jgi:hypothetical protein
MKVLLTQIKESLLSNIMIANSQEEVALLINAAVQSLPKNDDSDETLAEFVDELSIDLDEFNPHKETAQKWSNIKMARIVINRLKYHWNTANAFQ